MKSILYSAALAACAFASPSFAAESVNQPITFTGGTAAFGAEKNSSGTFSDHFTFNLPSNSFGSGSIITIALFLGGNLIRDIDFSSVTLTGPQGTAPYTLTSIGDQVESYVFMGGNLLAGQQTINVSGNVASQSGSYAGTFNIVPLAAVPEPSTWALLIVGFGAVGYSLRSGRRVRSHQAV